MGDFRIDKDPQYYLKRSPCAYVPLSAIQRSKINSYLAQNKDAKALLSPTQLEVLAAKESGQLKHDKIYHEDLKTAWIRL